MLASWSIFYVRLFDYSVRTFVCQWAKSGLTANRFRTGGNKKEKRAKKVESATENKAIACPKCGSNNVDIQLHQENQGSTTVTNTKSKYKQKGHGILWWLCIGWWWWIVEIMLWIVAFIPMLLIKCFRKKKYTGKSTSVASTKNVVTYKSVCLCKNCGNHCEVK